MAYFAKINNGLVECVISVNNSILGEPEKTFPETESIGVDFINNTLGLVGLWKQTSYNANFRKKYAGIGYSFDAEKDAFIPPKPFSSWILNNDTCEWNPPIRRPSGRWYWDEELISWKEITNDII